MAKCSTDHVRAIIHTNNYSYSTEKTYVGRLFRFIIFHNQRHPKDIDLELDEIILAYAISVHKSQGSEYPAVIIPIHTQHFILLQRNLLYTAITRARKLLCLVGTEKAIGIAIRNNKIQRTSPEIFHSRNCKRKRRRKNVKIKRKYNRTFRTDKKIQRRRSPSLPRFKLFS